MTETKKELQNNDRKVLAEHFKGTKFNDKMVFDFCTRHKIPMTDSGSIEDFIYQMDYDNRMKLVTPLILEVLSTYQVSAEYDTEERQKEILNSNNGIAEKVSFILEENGILYQEIECVKVLGADLAQLLHNADGLSSRMGANVLKEVAEEKLGHPLTLKSLADERAQIADRKYKKLEAEPKPEVAEDNREITDEELAGETCDMPEDRENTPSATEIANSDQKEDTAK